jgi:hypothetical protein
VRISIGSSFAEGFDGFFAGADDGEEDGVSCFNLSSVS